MISTELALTQSFLETNKEILHYPIDCYLSGSTGVSVLQFKN